jgi:DNA-binding response OmpR family regulator
MSIPLLIAVVDDDPSVRRALGRLLSSAGYGTLLFASGVEFLASPEAGAASCLLMDIHLGDMTGFEVCHRVRTAGSTAAIIFMTARDNDETRLRAASFPGSSYLRKPFDATELIGRIRAALGEPPLEGRNNHQSLHPAR